ncbi:Uncharacterised protein g7965 [Pycnogonum litorale]
MYPWLLFGAATFVCITGVLRGQGVGTVDINCLYCMCVGSSDCKSVRCHRPNEGGYYCGPYQITYAYWNDSGKPVIDSDHPSAPQAFIRCLEDFQCSSRTIIGYMNKWARDCDGDDRITCDDYARIHKAGPFGCRGKWSVQTQYWSKYRECMNSL